MIVALLYFATAILLLWLAGRFVTPLSRIAAICLLLIPLCFTGRALLRGRVYAPVEMAYMTFPLWGYRGELGIGEPERAILSDIAFQIVPWREATRRAVSEGEWPLLNRFMMSGDILAATAQPAPFSPFTWIALLVATPISFTYSGTIAFFIAALGTFLFLRELGCSEVAALFGAAAFALSAPIALQILWPLGFSWTFLPFVLVAMRRRSIGLLVVAFSLLALAGHPETLFHIVVISGVYALFDLLDRRLKPAPHLARVVAGGLIALLLSSIALLPFLEAAPQTMEHFLRNEIFSKLPFRATPGHARAALLSDLFPFARERFAMPLAQRAEAGSIALALAICGLFAAKSRQKWFFAGLLVVCLLAGARAWPVAPLLHQLPLFDMAINERLASAVPLCIAILAALGFDTLRGGAPASAGAFVSLLILLSVGAFVLRPVDTAIVIAELIPLAIATVIVWKGKQAAPILLGLLLIQRTMADGALIPVHRREVAYPPIALFEPLKPIRDPFRIVATDGTLIPNNATMYGFEDVRASTAMNLKIMEETNPLWCRQTGLGFQQVDDLTRPFLSMMNVRFALTRESDAIPDGWREVTVDHGTRLLENTNVLPRAFIPRSVRVASPPGADIEEMKLANDFAEMAWIDGRGVPQELPNGPGAVTIRRAKPGYNLDVDMQREGWCVISQASWKGWRASVDGQRAELRKANHAFLAVRVPAGKHDVRLVYLPQSFVWGRSLSVATLAGLVLLGVARSRRNANSAARTY